MWIAKARWWLRCQPSDPPKAFYFSSYEVARVIASLAMPFRTSRFCGFEAYWGYVLCLNDLCPSMVGLDEVNS